MDVPFFRKLIWYAIAKINGIQYEHVDVIASFLGDIELIVSMNRAILQKTLQKLRLPASIVQQILQMESMLRPFCSLKQAKDLGSSFDSPLVLEYLSLQQKGIHFVIREEKEFPNRLRNIPDAPYYLFYKGTLPSEMKPSISIIGARNCSLYGQEIALCFSKVFASCGIQIISGMARGIDGFAHKGALLANGYTCGVLGFGIETCYPREHESLKRELETKGCVLSEYSIHAPGMPRHFPQRNRLIAGLSDALLVVEAAKRSGTLITVNQALEQGKTIFAVPGRIGDRLCEGCNDIIRDGGKIVTDPLDVLSEFHMALVDEEKTLDNSTEKFKKIHLETTQKKVYASLDLQPKHIEQLTYLTKLPRNELLLCLLQLEQSGIIKQPMKNYYIRNIG